MFKSVVLPIANVCGIGNNTSLNIKNKLLVIPANVFGRYQFESDF
jgi:hypothetical protein